MTVCLIEHCSWQSPVDLNLLLMYSGQCLCTIGSSWAYTFLSSSYWSDMLKCFAELESGLDSCLYHVHLKSTRWSCYYYWLFYNLLYMHRDETLKHIVSRIYGVTLICSFDFSKLKGKIQAFSKTCSLGHVQYRYHLKCYESLFLSTFQIQGLVLCRFYQ